MDDGEASAIALALQLPDAYLIIDDKKGRKVAQGLGLRTIGTLGILLEAKHAGILNKLKPVLEAIRATDFRLTDELVDALLAQAGEL